MKKIKKNIYFKFFAPGFIFKEPSWSEICFLLGGYFMVKNGALVIFSENKDKKI